MVTKTKQIRRVEAEMKRQLACVLAACIGLQLPLGAFNAYGAQLPESAGPMEALEESKIPGLESDSRDEETQTEETEKETIPTEVHLKAIGRKMKRMEEQRQNQFPLQVPVSR